MAYENTITENIIMTKKQKITHGILTLGFILLTGCALLEPPPEDTEQITASLAPPQRFVYDADPHPGGTLNISMHNPATLNPLVNTDPTVDTMLGLIYEPLFTLDSLFPVPVLASSIDINDAYNHAVISIATRNWSDGVPVTAHDVVFSINTIKQQPNSLYRNHVSVIQSATAINDSTLQLTFTRAVGGRIEYYLTFPIIPRHFFYGNISTRAMETLGTGPFVVQTATFPREMLLFHNPQSNLTPYITAIRVLITHDRATDFNSLAQNIIGVLPTTLSELAQFGLSPVNHNITSYPTAKFDFIAFNFDFVPLQNINVRRAIAYALLDQDTVYTAYLGQASRTSSVVHPYNRVYHHGLSYHQQDMDKALELLYEAGFSHIDEDSRVMGSIAAGVPVPLSLRILVNNENAERLHIANILRQNLESLGIYINFMAVDFEEYQYEIANRNFDILFAGVDLGRDMRFLLSSTGSSNFMNYASQDLDSYLSQATFASTANAYYNTMLALQQYINTNLPIVGIAFRHNIIVTNAGISTAGGIPNTVSVYNGIENWFLY